jgi:hypothetical protein
MLVCELLESLGDIPRIIHPKKRTIAVYTSPDSPDAILGISDVLTATPVLPDFEVPVLELFTEVNRLMPPDSAGQNE